jgi:hypothetical protein
LGVLKVENGALRVRIPPELLPKAPAAPTATGGTVAKTGEKSPATMTDAERMQASVEIMREIGLERGTPASADQIEKAKKLAKDKGLDPDLLAARLAAPPGGRGRGSRGEGGGPSGGGNRGEGGGGSRRTAGGGAGDRGFNNTVVARDLYRFADPNAVEKKIEKVSVKLGVSDGFHTEVLEGLNEGDAVIKGVIMPGAAPLLAGPASGGMQNPFQSSGRGGFSSGPSSGGMRGGR